MADQSEERDGKMKFPEWQPDRWRPVGGNPLIDPLRGQTPRAVIGDPQVILPGEFDDLWHMFLIGEGGFYRFDSSDGTDWRLQRDYRWAAGPMCVTTEGGKWYVFYTHYLKKENRCDIEMRESEDLLEWSEESKVISPELEWEVEGRKVQVRNPCVVRLADGRYRMYYSGGTVWLEDCGYEEPKYIGFAESNNLAGHYEKNPEPILSPDESVWWRGFGAGAMKVFRYGELFLGLANGIYRDEEGRSRSAIDVLLSEDGLEWRDAPYNPIIKPGSGWEKALVYQLDLRWYKGRLWLFYNARDEWSEGIERIGCSILEWDGTRPEKMWDLAKPTNG